MITATIKADSINAVSRDRIVSYVLTYPRFIHSELMTHRVFSRNAASSRAIPIAKMIETCVKTPAEPVEFGTAQKGMQAGAPLEGTELDVVRGAWRRGVHQAAEIAQELLDRGVHKQVANRVLEPWAHMTTLVTATDWGNFFRLRAHPDAQPEFQQLAFAMLQCYVSSIPVVRQPGEWHYPFPDKMEGLNREEKLAVSTARCARLSYLTFDGEFSKEQDIRLHGQLLAGGHMSPFEHTAKAQNDSSIRLGNFQGWTQYRYTLPDPRVHQPFTLTEAYDLLSRWKRAEGVHAVVERWEQSEPDVV